MTKPNKQRVIIDCRPSGYCAVYADPEVEVICRSAHIPDDQLYLCSHEPIPEEWLIGKTIGFRGDGSEAETRAEWFAQAVRAAEDD